MNGMEKITARMKEDAARSLSELNAQTEQELRRIREESAARAEKERETAGGRAHLAAQERYERLCSAAEMETRKLTLSAKQKVLAETYDRAADLLHGYPTSPDAARWRFSAPCRARSTFRCWFAC